MRLYALEDGQKQLAVYQCASNDRMFDTPTGSPPLFNIFRLTANTKHDVILPACAQHAGAEGDTKQPASDRRGKEVRPMPEILLLALGVMFAAGTLLHTFKALEKEVTAHDASDIESGKSRKG